MLLLRKRYLLFVFDPVCQLGVVLGGTSDFWDTLSGWTLDMSLRYSDLSFRRSMSYDVLGKPKRDK